MESDEKLTTSVYIFLADSIKTAVDITKDCLPAPANSTDGNTGTVSLLRRLATFLCTGILMAPVMAVIVSIFILMSVSSCLLVALPAWRLRQHDYGVSGGDSSKASLVPALDMFYTLVLVQGILSIFLVLIVTTQGQVLNRFYNLCKFPEKWGLKAVRAYIEDTLTKCKQDITSIQGASLVSHASELVGSESWDSYITGVRVLGTFAKERMEGSRFTILLSRQKIQKLIWTLGLTQSSINEGLTQSLSNEEPGFLEVLLVKKEGPELRLSELREHAARIVASFADAIHLDQFPGAARCISTLLEATPDGNGVTSYELIVQGLAIIGKLALDHHNCQQICTMPGLLPKIMALMCSDNLIHQGTGIAKSGVVSGIFKVLRGLTRVPGKAGSGRRREISCNKQAVTNLERIILDEGNQHHDNKVEEDAAETIQKLAMDILLELVADESINLRAETIQNVIKKQLQIFLPDNKSEEAAAAAALFSPQKRMAGKALSLLSSNSKRNSTIITEAHSDNVDRLTEILDAEDIWHRIIAMEILRNLCKHCALNKKLVKEKLLPKVLSKIRQISNTSQQKEASFAQGGDEESQLSKERKEPPSFSQLIWKKAEEIARQMIEGKKHGRGKEKEQIGVKELQEILLSLTLQLYDFVGAASFAVVVQQDALGEAAFVANLKAILEENSKEATVTSLSLRIVKLCFQITISMLQLNQYRVHFNDQEFLPLVSTASENMFEFERCLIITDTTGFKKTQRPLVSELGNILKQELRGVR